MTRRWLAPLTVAAALAGATAPAAMIVHDPTSYGSLIEQARTALDQLESLREQAEHARALVRTLEEGPDLGDLENALGDPAVQQVLPEARDLQRLLDASSEGSALAKRAQDIREAQRVTGLPTGQGQLADLEAAGQRAARDMAIAEAASAAAMARTAVLEDLPQRIGEADTARGVMETQAYAASAQAQALNDLLRLETLRMGQAAEAQLVAQARMEAEAVARAERMALYRRSFQP